MDRTLCGDRDLSVDWKLPIDLGGVWSKAMTAIRQLSTSFGPGTPFFTRFHALVLVAQNAGQIASSRRFNIEDRLPSNSDSNYDWTW